MMSFRFLAVLQTLDGGHDRRGSLKATLREPTRRAVRLGLRNGSSGRKVKGKRVFV